jgi:hypothetical protein
MKYFLLSIAVTLGLSMSAQQILTDQWDGIVQEGDFGEPGSKVIAVKALNSSCTSKTPVFVYTQKTNGADRALMFSGSCIPGAKSSDITFVFEETDGSFTTIEVAGCFGTSDAVAVMSNSKIDEIVEACKRCTRVKVTVDPDNRYMTSKWFVFTLNGFTAAVNKVNL